MDSGIARPLAKRRFTFRQAMRESGCGDWAVHVKERIGYVEVSQKVAAVSVDNKDADRETFQNAVRPTVWNVAGLGIAAA